MGIEITTPSTVAWKRSAEVGLVSPGAGWADEDQMLITGVRGVHRAGGVVGIRARTVYLSDLEIRMRAWSTGVGMILPTPTQGLLSTSLNASRIPLLSVLACFSRGSGN